MLRPCPWSVPLGWMWRGVWVSEANAAPLRASAPESCPRTDTVGVAQGEAGPGSAG